MTNKEILKFAIRGIEGKIQIHCAWIGEAGVNEGRISDLKALISQYEEIEQAYENACKEEKE